MRERRSRFGTLHHRIERALADLERIQVQHQPRETAVADRVRESQVDCQGYDIDAERRAVFQAHGNRCQGDAAAARTVPDVAFHPGHHRAYRRQIDLVVAPA
jgi:hypothetical protein